jgi:protein SCO1
MRLCIHHQKPMSKSLGVLAIILCFLFSACERKVIAPGNTGEPKRYELKGKILKVEKENKRIEVAHEKIEGFMDAMTMPFAVKDDANFDKLQVGDQITATLIYNSSDNRSWLENIQVIKTN